MAIVGTVTNMAARELLRRRILIREDAFIEMVLWELPDPTPPCRHPYKYRLALVVGGICVVRYDNERGKGDHRHIGPSETSYLFVDAAALVSDLYQDTRRWLDEHRDV